MGRVKNMVSSTDHKATFAPLAPVSPAAIDTARPFALYAGSLLHHNGTMTTWSENNMTVAGEGYLEIYSADAAKAGITNGDNVKISSALGMITLKAKLSGALQAGVLFVPSNFREVQINLLAKDSSGAVAVKIEKG